jgi:hypothetical protein
MNSLCLKALVAVYALLTRLMRATRNETSSRQATVLVKRVIHGKWEAKLAQAYCAVETELAAIVIKLTKLTNMRKTPGISLFFSLRE